MHRVAGSVTVARLRPLISGQYHGAARNIGRKYERAAQTEFRGYATKFVRRPYFRGMFATKFRARELTVATPAIRITSVLAVDPM